MTNTDILRGMVPSPLRTNYYRFLRENLLELELAVRMRMHGILYENEVAEIFLPKKDEGQGLF